MWFCRNLNDFEDLNEKFLKFVRSGAELSLDPKNVIGVLKGLADFGMFCDQEMYESDMRDCVMQGSDPRGSI